jgi:hypothetical protein
MIKLPIKDNLPYALFKIKLNLMNIILRKVSGMNLTHYARHYAASIQNPDPFYEERYLD